MRLIRGTGLRGLGGIHPRILVEREEAQHEDVEHQGVVHGDKESHGEIIRPLLMIRRRELEQYLTGLKQPWREDTSNVDSKFTRNRVRKLVLPLLEREFNPAVVENFAELAEIARDEEDYWENEISGWLGTVVQWSEPGWPSGLSGSGNSQRLVQIRPSDTGEGVTRTDKMPMVETPFEGAGYSSGHGVLPSAQDDNITATASVSRPWLLTEAKAVQRRVLKAIGQHAGIPLGFEHIEEVLRFAAEEGPSGKELSLPLGWKIVREPEAMVFVAPVPQRREQVPDYEYALAVPGRVLVAELGVVFEALRITPESRPPEHNAQLFRAESLPTQLIVRNWRAGDRFWPAHTRSPKKIKELLQQRHVTQPERRRWPVVVSGNEIVWMRGFPVPARLLAQAGEEAVLIRELRWGNEEHDS